MTGILILIASIGWVGFIICFIFYIRLLRNEKKEE